MISGGLLRMQLIYPYCVFRARVDYKNIAPGKEWTTGPLFFDGQRNYYILEKDTKKDDGYNFKCIHPGPVYLDTYFKNGKKEEIFEGDILTVTCYDRLELRKLEREKEDERMVFASLPLEFHQMSSYSGVVVYYGGIPYFQYMNTSDGYVYTTPLYLFFDADELPKDGYVIETLGNVYDDRNLQEEIFSLDEKTGYTRYNTISEAV